MSAPTHASSATKLRDAGLRRIEHLNRWLIAGTVVATGVLTDVAANAFSGHTLKHAASASSSGAPSAPASASGSSATDPGGSAGSSASTNSSDSSGSSLQPSPAPAATASAPAAVSGGS